MLEYYVDHGDADEKEEIVNKLTNEEFSVCKTMWCIAQMNIKIKRAAKKKKAEFKSQKPKKSHLLTLKL